MKRAFIKTFSLIIILQMMLSPLAFANQSGQNVLGALGGIATDMLHSYNQQTQMNMARMNGPQMQFQQSSHEFYKKENLLRIPGFADYLKKSGKSPQVLDCVVPDKRIEINKPDVCEIGVLANAEMPVPMQIEQAKSFADYYSTLKQRYEDYQPPGRGNELYGIPCMQTAAGFLKGFFAQKLADFDLIKAELEAIHDKFKKKSKADLDKIAFTAALLTGGNSELVEDMKGKFPEEFKFDNVVGKIPGCSSMMSGEKITALGNGGLNGILDDVKSEYDKKSGKYSAASFSPQSTQIADVEKDIENVIKSVELKTKVSSANFSNPESISQVVGDLRTINSPNGFSKNLNLATFAESLSSLQERQTKFNTNRDEVAAVLGTDIPSSVMNQNKKIDNDVSDITRSLQLGCMREQFKGMPLAQITNPDNFSSSEGSSFATKNSSLQSLNGEFSSVFDGSKDLDEMTDAIKRISQKHHLGRFNLKRSSYYKTYEASGNGFVEVDIKGKSFRSPGQVLEDLVKICKAKFKTKAPGKAMSQEDAIKQLKSLKNDYNAMTQSLVADMKKELRKKLITCEQSSDANASGVGSCSSGAFDTGSAGFCLNKAKACGASMNSCKEKLQAKIAPIEKAQARSIINYQANMKKYQADLNKMLDRTMGQLIAESSILSAPPFGVPFTAPELTRDVKAMSLYNDEFKGLKTPNGSSILIDDPDKFLEYQKKNIDSMKKSFQAQVASLVGNTDASTPIGGLLATKIKDEGDLYTKNIKLAGEIATKCNNVYNTALKTSDQQMNDTAKTEGEMQGKFQEACDQFGPLNENPIGACMGLKDISTDLLSAIGQMDMKDGVSSGARETAYQIKSTCQLYMKQVENQSSNVGLTPKESAKKVCTDKPNTAGCDFVKPHELDQIGTVSCGDIVSKKPIEKFCLVGEEIKVMDKDCASVGGTPLLASDLPVKALLKAKMSSECPVNLEEKYLAISQSGGGNYSQDEIKQALVTMGQQMDGYCAAQNTMGPYNTKSIWESFVNDSARDLANKNTTTVK